jgi:antitoxin ParD1/3/4
VSRVDSGAAMPSSFALGDYFENFIRSMVASGRYSDASEVVRDGLRALEDRERERARDEAELDAFLAESFKDIEEGRVYPIEQVFDELRADIEAVREAEAAK